jgi:hypothetical protein
VVISVEDGDGMTGKDTNRYPVPDPTSLTTDQMRREVAGLKELLTSQIEAIEQALALRIDEVARYPQRVSTEVQHLRDLHERDIGNVQQQFKERDKRTELAAEHAKTSIDAALAAVEDTRESYQRQASSMLDTALRAVGELKSLHNERFSSIGQQFIERDVRTTQASGAADDALKAALQAAKELVGAQGEASSAAAVKSETSFTKQIDQIGTIIQTLEKALDARITELKERIDRGEGAGAGAGNQRTESRAAMQVGFAALGVILVIITIAIAIYSAKK